MRKLEPNLPTAIDRLSHRSKHSLRTIVALGGLMRGGSVLLAAAVVASCAVGPDYHTPNVRVPDHFDSVERAPAAQPGQAPQSSAELATWWRTLGDTQLDSLIDRAVTGNPSVLVALDRLQAARVYEAGLTGSLLPAIGASGGFGRGTGSDLTRGRATQPLVSADNTRGLTNVTAVGGFDALWEIDVFGRVRREIEQARYETEATADARSGVLVSVIADVAHAYVDLRGLQMRALVLRSAADILGEGVRIATERYERGITNELDVTLAKRELASVEAEIPITDGEMSSGEYAIATLLGEYPEDVVKQLANPGMIPVVPATVSQGLPLDLLRRRPDVMEAERDIASANAGIGVATADLFPQFIATGSIGFQRGTLGSAELGEHIWSAGAGAIWPLLDFGRLDARVQVANYQTRAALEHYKATVQTAVQQVDSAAARFYASQQSLKRLADALVASQRAATLAKQRYERGLTDYLNVVDAEREAYSIQEQYVATQTTVDDQYIELYRNLGGGWQGYQGLPPIPRPLPAVLAIFKDTLARSNPISGSGPPAPGR
jgi:NodT family efflux transporter outer membrane factor (OMF) lipoprotein